MSSPAPSDVKPLEHAYQSSETISCNCSDKLDKTIEQIQPLPQQIQQHNQTNLVHSISQVHVHVHAAHQSPPSALPPCSCHMQNSDDLAHLQHQQNEQRVKIEADDRIEISPLPPALPPRPPPRPRYDCNDSLGNRYRQRSSSPAGGRIRKYVFWCCACGGLATILGALFLAVYFLLRSYTSTLGYFETIPTFVPATMLILTGLCVMSLARRKNRYSYLLKVCGVCCLVCALTCVLVTITTTVIHMNRLQTLRECVYTQKTRTCTCYSVLLEAHPHADEGVRFVFDSTPDCEVIHGALYTCLRAMFGLSVTGILVCIFSCMLVYQLLSHERKKMYWEQLELRCRSFYQQHGAPPASAPSSMRGPPMTMMAPMPPATYCSCCDECRYPQIVPASATPAQMYPWDDRAERFWTPGRVGNFYSPNPGEDVPAPTTENRNPSGMWNWRRLPWNRNTDTSPQGSATYQGIASSADSQYGFSHRPPGAEDTRQHVHPVSSTESYSVLDARRPLGGVYVWGPPPPYSNPNSPARRPIHSPARGTYHHVHQHHHPGSHDSHCQMNDESLRNLQDFQREIRERRSRHKDNYENAGEVEYHRPHGHHAHAHTHSNETDTSSNGGPERTSSHTLPVRKVKKRMDMASVKSVAPVPTSRTSVKNVFQQEIAPTHEDEHKYHEPDLQGIKNLDEPNCRFLPRLQGVENAAFQKQEASPPPLHNTTESEVYFADVSSCCNISVRNDGLDGQDSSLYDEANNHQGDEEVAFSVRRPPLPLPLENTSTGLQKDISCNSIASSVQTPMTETTDDCVTPTTDCAYLAPDAQYEVIQEAGTSSNLTATISSLGAFNYFPSPSPNSRRNLVKMGYNEPLHGGCGVGVGEEEIRQSSHNSDVTVDSGWQSGSEKPECMEIHQPVNV